MLEDKPKSFLPKGAEVRGLRGEDSVERTMAVFRIKNTEGFGRITVPSRDFPDLGSLFSNFVKK